MAGDQGSADAFAAIAAALIDEPDIGEGTGFGGSGGLRVDGRIFEGGTRLAMRNSQSGADVAAPAPVPRWGWGEAPPYQP